MENSDDEHHATIFEDIAATLAVLYYAGALFVIFSAACFGLWIWERAQ